MQYHVRALTADHLITELVLHGSDEADVRRQLESRGLFASTIAPANRAFSAGSRIGSPRIKGWSVLLFSVEVLALLKAGLNIVECLEALLEKESGPAVRPILNRLLADLREGKRFSAALSNQPDCFPPLYVAIVEAAESTSDLPRALARFIDYQRRVDEVRNKVVMASIYPVILLCVGCGVSIFLIAYVVPRFAEVYQGSGRNLPRLSQWMMEWGRFAGDHASALAWGAAIMLPAAFFFLRHFIERFGWRPIFSLLPGLATRLRIHQLARLYLTLGMLLEGGIPIVAAMGKVLGMMQADLRAGLQAAIHAVSSGTPVSAAFEANHLATPVSLRLLRVGERSGELGRMLSQSAAFYDEEINRSIDRFTRTFEPLLMAAIGLLVGLIVVLLYMPIFDLAEGLA